jgi:hypothetical protein
VQDRFGQTNKETEALTAIPGLMINRPKPQNRILTQSGECFAGSREPGIFWLHLCPGG